MFIVIFKSVKLYLVFLKFQYKQKTEKDWMSLEQQLQESKDKIGDLQVRIASAALYRAHFLTNGHVFHRVTSSNCLTAFPVKIWNIIRVNEADEVTSYQGDCNELTAWKWTM